MTVMWTIGTVTLTLFGILQLADVIEPTSALQQQHQYGDSVQISHRSRPMSAEVHAPSKQFTRQEGIVRQTRSMGLIMMSANFTLATNTSLNCSTGLTHAGVYVQVEYRLTSMPVEWIPLTNVTLDPTSKIYT